jgi:hypothetical protein
MTRYHTNLAAEFHVLSCLHRAGLDAHLTLGNRKSVDIFVVLDAGEVVTVEVKGLAGKYEWPAGNLHSDRPDHHFVVLVGFEGRIDDPEMPPPRVWVVPYREIDRFTQEYATRTNVSRSRMLNEGAEFENAWWRIAGGSTP